MKRLFRFNISFFLVIVGAVFLMLSPKLLVENHEETSFNKKDSLIVDKSNALEEAPSTVTILAVGDMFFDRQIRSISERNGGDYLFSCINPLFSRAEFVVGNLEGPITSYKSRSQGSVVGSADNYIFTFPTSTAELLFKHKVTVVNLGNNHIYNFGVNGVLTTHVALDSAGVSYFGGYKGVEPVLQKESNGVPLSFVSYNQFGGSSATEVSAVIKKEKDAGRVVVVYAHWGEEYTDTRSALRALATLFVQSGAGVVLGSHQHIILPHETITTSPVYYSLGNFIFDQYWNKEVSTGLTVLLTLDKNGVVHAEPVEVTLGKDGRTCVKANV